VLFFGILAPLVVVAHSSAPAWPSFAFSGRMLLGLFLVFTGIKLLFTAMSGSSPRDRVIRHFAAGCQ